jgi:hypothetical protein
MFIINVPYFMLNLKIQFFGCTLVEDKQNYLWLILPSFLSIPKASHNPET